MRNAHLTSCLEQSFDSGFEFYTFEVSETGVAAALEAEKRVGRGQELKRFLAGCYTQPRRPEWQDIAEIIMTPGERGRVRVTLKIMRGTYWIMDFMKSHIFHGGFWTDASPEELIISCLCDARFSLDPRSIR